MTWTVSAEQVGDSFSLALMQQAQQQSWLALRQIAAAIRPGMLESEARQLAKDILAAQGAEKLWHPIIIRFGGNTCKTYDQPSDKHIRLQADDIFFIDLGPVFAGHEGDVGATFVLGDDPQKLQCAAAARTVFHQVRQRWLAGDCSGADLYQFASQQTAALGFALNLAIKGHRISDFPHKLYAGGELGDMQHQPDAGVWVLEIQLRHPTLPMGAFYEDVLLATDCAEAC
jgi:Xaa-Pro aminopeptidase